MATCWRIAASLRSLELKVVGSSCGRPELNAGTHVIPYLSWVNEPIPVSVPFRGRAPVSVPFRGRGRGVRQTRSLSSDPQATARANVLDTRVVGDGVFHGTPSEAPGLWVAGNDRDIRCGLLTPGFFESDPSWGS